MNTHAPLTIERPAVLTGTVKWFDSAKCFGFVVVPDFRRDFLLHRHVLESFGRNSIAEGSTVAFRYEQSANGLKITHIISVEAPIEMTDRGEALGPTNVSTEKFPARVKWFDNRKGYGFVNCFGSDEDIFIGLNVLRRSAMQEIAKGEALCVQIAEVDGRRSVCQIYDWQSK